jgi:Nickel responsive protein SCO4226-like
MADADGGRARPPWRAYAVCGGCCWSSSPALDHLRGQVAPLEGLGSAPPKVFCLVDAPDAESAAHVHREAHGLVADRIFAVEEGA